MGPLRLLLAMWRRQGRIYTIECPPQKGSKMSNQYNKLYPHFEEQVLKAERERIQQQRRNRRDEGQGGVGADEDKLMGLALSGGGIRSASFGLGVLQSLQKHGLLTRLDYLATVSGGGYIGSSLTWFRHLLKDTTFPFGQRGYGARRPASKSPDALDFIRQHGNYLEPRPLGFWALIATMLRVILLTLSIYFALAVVLLYGLIDLGLIAALGPMKGTLVGSSQPLFYVALLGAGLFAAMAVVYSLLTWVVWLAHRLVSHSETWVPRFSRATEQALGNWVYRGSIILQRSMGAVLPLLAAIMVVASLPYVAVWLEHLQYSGSASLIGVLGGIYQFFRAQRGKDGEGGLSNRLIIWISAVLLIYGGLVFAYGVAELLRSAGYGSTMLGVGGILVALVALLVNLNGFGLGPMYRDRLAETFLPDPVAVRDNVWQPAFQANVAPLSTMCSPEEPGPYHLICSNVVLTDSDKMRYRGRGGDSFVLAPIMSGSDATGWQPTEELLADRMTLATAMATSAAAINPHASAFGRGVMRNRLVSFLLSVLGLRTGYWTRSPWASRMARFLTTFLAPNLLYPGLRQGLLGYGLDARAGYLTLTDGGHFENLGLYELVRRKVDCILVSDAGVDPDFTLQNMSNAIERIRVDFGFQIRFGVRPETDYGIDNLISGSVNDGESEFNARFDVSRRAFAIGRIDYGDKEGVLYWLKSTLIPGLPEDIYGYKAVNPAFPYQSTTDQFFDEAQLEAYRELGYRLCESFIADRGEAL